MLLAFRLYDSKGQLAAESDGLEHFPTGITVRARGEVLLSVPADQTKPIHYRFYNCQGSLLTTSNGGRTKIYPLLRMGARAQPHTRSA